MAGRPLSREAFADQLCVPRETLDKLTLHLDLLRRWQRAINLVGPTTLDDPWRRHVLDSAQLAGHLPPGATSLVDLGSGAGFPGMVLALLGAPGVHLIESDRRKAQFLREAARATGARVTIHAERIEALRGWPADVIAARALAPLPRLLEHADSWVRQRLPASEGQVGPARIDQCAKELAYGVRNVAKPGAAHRGGSALARSSPCA